MTQRPAPGEQNEYYSHAEAWPVSGVQPDHQGWHGTNEHATPNRKTLL